MNACEYACNGQPQLNAQSMPFEHTWKNGLLLTICPIFFFISPSLDTCLEDFNDTHEY